MTIGRVARTAHGVVGVDATDHATSPCSAATPRDPHARSIDRSTARRQPCRSRRMADRQGHRSAATARAADGEPVATQETGGGTVAGFRSAAWECQPANCRITGPADHWAAIVERSLARLAPASTLGRRDRVPGPGDRAHRVDRVGRVTTRCAGGQAGGRSSTAVISPPTTTARTGCRQNDAISAPLIRTLLCDASESAIAAGSWPRGGRLRRPGVDRRPFQRARNPAADARACRRRGALAGASRVRAVPHRCWPRNSASTRRRRPATFTSPCCAASEWCRCRNRRHRARSTTRLGPRCVPIAGCTRSASSDARPSPAAERPRGLHSRSATSIGPGPAPTRSLGLTDAVRPRQGQH